MLNTLLKIYYAHLLLIVPLTTYSQGEENFWYFGENAGLNFNSGAPVAVTNGQLSTTEGCAGISDPTGNLLFYTDGKTIWDKTHTAMPNGTGLLGHSSSTQSAMIIQKPGSANIYYVFTVDAFAFINGIRYSEVDISLNSGKGDVTANKNIFLNTSSCEKITGVRHCNNKDIWVVTHDWMKNTFRTYLVTSAGVNIVPVLSNAGPVYTPPGNQFVGYLKASPDGKKLAVAVYNATVELYDFDKATGIVSNPLLLLTSENFSYGVEFSPDGTKLYGSMNGTSMRIYQFDLCAGSDAAIINSGVVIGTISAPYPGALQLGPDKKIYAARWGASWVGVINSPNTLGAACNYVDNGVALAGRLSRYGLPNFVPYYFKPPPPPFTTVINCLDGVFTAPQVNVSNCSAASNAITSVEWNFGDVASGVNNTSTNNNPTHTFTSPGNYNVYLVLNYSCGADTLIKTITVSSCTCTLTAQFTKGTATCTNCGCQEWIIVNAVNGSPPYTYLWPDAYDKRYKNKVCPGNYLIKVTDKNGCSVDVNVSAP